MTMKKMTYHIITVVCLYGMAITATIDIMPPQEEANVVAEIADYNNEQAIILKGDASCGKDAITGPACVVIKRKQLKKIRKGDIVVAHEINTLWRGGLESAAGIIIEKGDAHSYALELGKKLGIPVIVGATGATKNIVDGQIITCDPATCNVYHVAYPDAQKPRFDIVHVSQKDFGQKRLHDKLANAPVFDIAEKDDQPAMRMNDHVVVRPYVDRGVIIQNSVEHQVAKRITKDVHRAHFNRLKKFALTTQADYKWAKKWGVLERGARLTGRDPFTIDCMAIGDVLLGNSEKYLIEVFERLGEEKYIDYMNIVLDKCLKRPKNIKEVNWMAWVSHREHVDKISMPDGIDKEKLMEDPKEYKKVEDLIDKQERENLIAAGIGVMYYMDNLPNLLQ